MRLQFLSWPLILTLIAAGSAQAQCKVTAQGSAAAIALAQNMVRHSEYFAVASAYGSHSCTITKLLHPGGRPCHGVQDHVTVSVDGVTYHVIDLMRANGLCTTW
jgi:hypothetical protein